MNARERRKLRRQHVDEWAECPKKMWESLRTPRVSYRVFGPNKEFRRPIIHRFPIKEGDTLLSAMAENVVTNNSIFKRLTKR